MILGDELGLAEHDVRGGVEVVGGDAQQRRGGRGEPHVERLQAGSDQVGEVGVGQPSA